MVAADAVLIPSEGFLALNRQMPGNRGREDGAGFLKEVGTQTEVCATVTYLPLGLAEFVRLARTFARRWVGPPRFLVAGPEVADCTMYAERVMPA